VLAERHRDGQPPGLDARSVPQLVEREPEERSVRDVYREPGPPPVASARQGLAEDRDVRVVATEELPVDGLLGGPDGGGRGPRARRTDATTARRKRDQDVTVAGSGSSRSSDTRS
jgi:hypothetical protein